MIEEGEKQREGEERKERGRGVRKEEKSLHCL